MEKGLKGDVQVGGGEIQHGLQIGEGAVAAGFALCRGEDTHQSFHESIGEEIAVPVSEDAIKMFEDGFPDALHGCQELVHPCRPICPGDPLFEASAGADGTLGAVDFLQGQTHLVGLGRLQVELGEVVQGLRLLFGQVPGVLQEDVALLFHHGGVIGNRFHFLAPDLVHGVVGHFDDVELVKDQLRVGRVLARPGLVGLAHVDRAPEDLSGIPAVFAQISGEALPGRLLLRLGRKEHLALACVGEHRGVDAPLADGQFVAADRVHFAHLLFFTGFFHMAAEHAPKTGVMLSHEGRHGLHRALPHQQQSHRFEGQGKMLGQPLPRRPDRGHLAALPARQPADDLASVFKDVQMPPTPLLPMVVADKGASILETPRGRPQRFRFRNGDLHGPVGLAHRQSRHFPLGPEAQQLVEHTLWIHARFYDKGTRHQQFIPTRISEEPFFPATISEETRFLPRHCPVC